MRADEWSDLKAAFAELIELAPGERTERLERLAHLRPALAARLEALIAADSAADARLGVYEEALGGRAAPVVHEPDPLGLVGRTIGHFRIEEVLGRGGMGVAYRAHDTRLDRSVALKFLLPRHAIDGAGKATLLHEARAASALDHPNVCTVFEVGEAEAGLFFAMPAYSGETLAQRLARDGALPPEQALDITRQLLQGLAAAHAAGITHRDLKPGNLMVTGDGTLKILDFGLATMRDPDGIGAGATPGTIAYMSPEQLTAGTIDPRTDLWAVGVILHELLTGERPFGAGTALATPWNILHDEPPAPGITPGIDAFVMRLLRKLPADRFSSARDALAALDGITRPQPPGVAATRRPFRVRRTVIAVGAILASIAGGVLLRAGRGAPNVSDTPSVAVLPFSDDSPDRSQPYLAEGIAEEILNALAAVQGLRVPGRRSSFGSGSDTVPLAEVARPLGVENVLDGRVQRDGDRIRISARLVEARTGAPIWSRSFDRPVRDIFTVQTEIANAIAAALTTRSGAAPAVHAARNSAAYELYLRGLFHWHRRTPQDLARAIDFFHQATRHDSLYAQPWAGLALAYAVLPPLTGTSFELLDRADSAAARALALDSTLADAHAARGYARHWQWRWTEAEQELRHAIALNPASSTAHQWYAEHLAKMGRMAEGERLMRRAIDLDPLSLVAQNDLGIVLMLSRRYDEAIAQFRRVQQADPAFALPLLLQHRTFLVMGDAASAAEAGRRWAEVGGIADPAEITLLARATLDRALVPQAVAVLEAWQRQESPRWPDIALYFTLLGEHGRALDALERALAVRSPMLAGLKVSSWADPLRDDPRFVRILRQLAFP